MTPWRSQGSGEEIREGGRSGSGGGGGCGGCGWCVWELVVEVVVMLLLLDVGSSEACISSAHPCEVNERSSMHHPRHVMLLSKATATATQTFQLDGAFDLCSCRLFALLTMKSVTGARHFTRRHCGLGRKVSPPSSINIRLYSAPLSVISTRFSSSSRFFTRLYHPRGMIRRHDARNSPTFNATGRSQHACRRELHLSLSQVSLSILPS